MELRAEHITIAVTVYSRRQFIGEAIRSALTQTVPVRVIVVEDCGPDATLRDLIVGEFGERIEYFRNPQNRGLFDNWNACLGYCRTPWLSILHDDDVLRPNFVETMLALAKTAPDRALYFGRACGLTEGKVSPAPPIAWTTPWRDLPLPEFAEECDVLFPGQLLRCDAARAVGGFKPVSYFTGDWDMWFRLALRFGAAQTATEISLNRSHEGPDRGTSVVLRKGWKWALDNVQRKRNLAWLARERGVVIPFDRAKLVRESPVPSRWLGQQAHGFSRRMVFYNWWLFTHSRPPHWRYALMQWLARLVGPQSLRLVSGLRKKK